MRIFLDPGHGGNDPGAVGPTGLRESSVALDVARALERLLAAGIHTVDLSRDDDATALDLDTRARRSNAWGADLFVSIHCNAATNRAARGIETWTTRGQTAADPVADHLLFHLGRAFPGLPLRRDLLDGDGDKEKDYRVLVETAAPAVLVELGFISHPETEAAMRSPSWISAAAGGLAAGIHAWILSSKGGT